jgi:hypothetical protein
VTAVNWGRCVEHDVRSWRYPAARASEPAIVLWPHRAPVLDQFFLGACTGFSLAQVLNTTRFVRSRPRGRYLGQDAAIALYSGATTRDTIAGAYPPLDTGSSGLAVCKAGVDLGYLSRYEHAFGFAHFAAALTLSPVIVGTGWSEEMCYPDAQGFVWPGKNTDDSGHQYAVLGINPRTEVLTFLNSWGPGWGRNGRFYMTFAVFRKLLSANGDVCVPIGVRAV